MSLGKKQNKLSADNFAEVAQWAKGRLTHHGVVVKTQTGLVEAKEGDTIKVADNGDVTVMFASQAEDAVVAQNPDVELQINDQDAEEPAAKK